MTADVARLVTLLFVPARWPFKRAGTGLAKSVQPTNGFRLVPVAHVASSAR